MGRDDRHAVSRIKLENLPKSAQGEAKFVGPLGLLRIVQPADGVAASKLLYLGPFGPFELPGNELYSPL